MDKIATIHVLIDCTVMAFDLMVNREIDYWELRKNDTVLYRFTYEPSVLTCEDFARRLWT